MSASIRNMTDINQLPNSGEFIILDTSVVLGLTKQSKDQLADFNICSTFISNTMQNKNIIGITAKTYEEIQYLAERRNFPNDKKKINFASNISQAEQLVAYIYNGLKKFKNFSPDLIGGDISPSALIKDMEKNRKTHKLRIGDAQILTQAYSEGVYNICTLDKDWINVKDPNVVILTQQRYISNNTSNILSPSNASQSIVENASQPK